MGYTKVQLEPISVTPPPQGQQEKSQTSSRVTPTPLLTRQQSSITADDLAFYDTIPKEPTPLLGSWADVWSSRQASEIILEDIDKEKESASMQLIETAAEEEGQDEDELVRATSDADDMSHPSASSVSTAATTATGAIPLDDALVDTVQSQEEFAYPPEPQTTQEFNNVAVPQQQYVATPQYDYSHAQYQYPVDPTLEAHARHVYYNNPYSAVNTRNDLHICQCASCIAQNQAKHAEIARQQAAVAEPRLQDVFGGSSSADSNANTLSSAGNSPLALPAAPVAEAPLPIKLASPAVPPTTGGFQTHSAVPPPPPHAPRDVVPAVVSHKTTTSTSPGAGMSAINDNAEAMPRQLSLFMPPPPPSLMTPEILERDGTQNVAGFIRHAMNRWYTKAANVQGYFVPETDACPVPESMDFAAWCQACTDWWFRNFEFAQMKPSTYAAMQGYAAPFAGGYNTAAPAAAVPAPFNASAAASQAW